MAAGHDLGLVSRVYEVFERFEPVISVALDLGQPLRHRRLLAHQFLLAPQVFLACYSAVEVRIEKAVEPGLDGREARLLCLSETGRGLGRLHLPFRDPPPHLPGPGIGQRDLLNGLPHLSGQGLLANIALRTRSEFLGAAVIVMALLPLGGDGAAAFAATDKSEKRKHMPPFGMHLPPARHHLLNPLKQVAGNQWFVRALVQLALQVKLPDIERVHKQPLDAPEGERFSRAVHQAPGRELLADILKRVTAGRIGFEHPAHKGCGGRVHDDGA